MSETEEQSQTSDSDFDSIPQESSINVLQTAREVLATHEDLDEYYKNMPPEKRFEIAASIMYNPYLQSVSDELLTWRLELYFEIKQHPIIGAQHFSKASAECIETYRSGNFIACTMMTHPLNEALIKFVVERNNIARGSEEDLTDTIDKLRQRNLLNDESVTASKAIYRSYRNDIHHMNKKVDDIKDWHEFAKRNLRNLTKVESCVFGFDFLDGGTIRPHYLQHWDPVGDDLIQIYARFD